MERITTIKTISWPVPFQVLKSNGNTLSKKSGDNSINNIVRDRIR